MTRSRRTFVASPSFNCFLGCETHRPKPRFVSNSSRALHHCGRPYKRGLSLLKNDGIVGDKVKMDHNRPYKPHETHTRVIQHGGIVFDLRSNRREMRRRDVASETEEALCRIDLVSRRKSDPRIAIDGDSTSDQPPEVWHNNLFAPTSTMCQRSKRVAIELSRPKRWVRFCGFLKNTALSCKPTASGNRRRQPLRTSLGYDSHSRHSRV